MFRLRTGSSPSVSLVMLNFYVNVSLAFRMAWLLEFDTGNFYVFIASVSQY